MRDIIECINSQCGASAGDCGCAARLREVAALLDALAERCDIPPTSITQIAFDCRAMAKKLRGEA